MNMQIGIIGFGFIGHLHWRHLQNMEGIRIVAVCDIDPEQLKDVQDTPGLNVYHDADQMIADPKVNVVLVAVPNHLHLEMVLKAAKAKKHILCEKPAAMNVAQFDQMMHAVRENNVMFSVHQQRRFDKDFAIAKRVFDEGMVGKPYVIKSQLYGANGYMHDWHVYKKYGGGMLYDWGVHLIDQMLYMVPGKIRTVYADIRNVINEEVDDYFRIELLFESGISAEIELGTYYLTPKRGWFIGGDTGNLIVDGFGGSEGQIVRTTHLLENVPGKITMTAAGPTRSFSPNQKDVLYTEPMPEVHVNHLMYFENFLNAMNGAEPFLVTPAQVRRVLMVMDAARESAAVGRSIHFLERETKI